ncbi:MAG TPA: hypothetical protein VIC85_06520 [Ktedonobacterales bacterium]|jgi:hypothetical protein
MDASDRSVDTRGGDVRLSPGLGMDIHEARRAVAELAAARGYGPDAPREWRSPEPEHPAEMGRPPLFYAALRPGDGVDAAGHTDDGDAMPLGLGATPEEALADLLWALAGPALSALLAEPEAERLELAALEDEAEPDLASADLASADLVAPGDEGAGPGMSAQ